MCASGICLNVFFLETRIIQLTAKKKRQGELSSGTSEVPESAAALKLRHLWS